MTWVEYYLKYAGNSQKVKGNIKLKYKIKREGTIKVPSRFINTTNMGDVEEKIGFLAITASSSLVKG